MKKETDESKDVFKKPSAPVGTSLFGLDRLAKLKRENKEKEHFNDKRIKLGTENIDDSSESFRKDGASRKTRLVVLEFSR